VRGRAQDPRHRSAHAYFSQEARTCSKAAALPACGWRSTRDWAMGRGGGREGGFPIITAAHAPTWASIREPWTLPFLYPVLGSLSFSLFSHTYMRVHSYVECSFVNFITRYNGLDYRAKVKLLITLHLTCHQRKLIDLFCNICHCTRALSILKAEL
jgi:hypothetical protein